MEVPEENGMRIEVTDGDMASEHEETLEELDPIIEPETPPPVADEQPDSGEPLPASAAGKKVPKTEYEALNDKYVRLHAEFDNYKKRIARDREELRKHANVNVLSAGSGLTLPMWSDPIDVSLRHWRPACNPDGWCREFRHL